MGTTAEKLALLKTTKADMKAALTEQGQNPGDVFADYPDMVRAIQTGVTLPTLTNPGGAADLRKGKQLIDQAGQIVDGTLEEVQQATPSISVNSSGLITATAGDKSATHQLSSSDSSKFSESNIRKGVNLFGKTGTMRPMNTASFNDFTAGDGYIEFSNTDFFGDVTSPSTLVVENAWVSIIIGTQYNSFAREMLFMTNNLSVTGANGYFRLYEVGDEKKECTASLSFSGGAIKLRIESEEFAGLSNSSSDSLYVYMVMGAFAYTC